MATNDLNTKMTLLDIQKSMDPKGNLVKVAEILTKKVSPLKDAPWEQCNDGSSHVYGEETFLAQADYGAINEGWGAGKSESIERRAYSSEYVLDSRVDKRILKGPNGMQVRHYKDKRIVEGIGQQMCTDMFYGSGLGKVPEGFFTKFNSTSLPNVINNGASTGTTLRSMLLVEWGLDTVSLLYPEGFKGGLSMENKGEISTIDANDKRVEWEITKFQAHMGLKVADTRAVQRICNIAPYGSTNDLDYTKIVQAINKLPNRGEGAVIYADRELYTQLEILAMDKTNAYYKDDNVFGGRILHFQNVPVHMVEVLADEAVVGA
jgi:hypothetical protein